MTQLVQVGFLKVQHNLKLIIILPRVLGKASDKETKELRLDPTLNFQMVLKAVIWKHLHGMLHVHSHLNYLDNNRTKHSIQSTHAHTVKNVRMLTAYTIFFYFFYLFFMKLYATCAMDT